MADWAAEIPHKSSAKKNGRAFYNPYVYGSDELINELEMRCWEEGILIERTGKKYMHVVGQIVGVCSGEVTEYVFAECASGFVHGRPISTTALKGMGVDI